MVPKVCRSTCAVVSSSWLAASARAATTSLAPRAESRPPRWFRNGTLSVSGLARLYPMSTTAVQKHVAVLEEAGLVHLTRRGRQQLVQTEIDTIAEAHAMLAEFERLWRGRLDRIGDVLAEPAGGDRP